ncbi:MAG TPA: STAS domain-containing protein [Gaiellaceae bacterium]|nr:STAS domain-containing protein [Gaiellaceae bacterium]
MTLLASEIRGAWLCDDAFAVTAIGELDLHDAPTLERELRAAEAAGARRALVDLSAVSFADSTILGVLVGAAQRFEELVLAVSDVRVLRVLEITGLDRKLRVERSRQEALAALSVRRAA